MFGKIFITRTGYDPEHGKHIKDPYLGDEPSIGACRPDVRKRLKIGDHLFLVSGRVPGHKQTVLGGFEVAKKITAVDAYRDFPDQRLHKRADGQLDGNVIVTAKGRQHRLDDHKGFERRTENYIVGRDLIALKTPQEMSRGREQTIEALQEILKTKADSVIEILSRFGRDLTDEQVFALRKWLRSLKEPELLTVRKVS